MPLMAASNHVRWGAIGFLLGGLVWVVSGLLIVFGSRIMGPHPVYFLLFVVALLLTSAGLIGLHALQEGSYGLIGQVGLYTVLLAFALQALGGIAPPCSLTSGSCPAGAGATPRRAAGSGRRARRRTAGRRC